MSAIECKVKWCAAMAGPSGFCGPHTQWPALEGEKPDEWTSRTARLSKALRKLLQHAETVAAVLSETPQEAWQIVRATRLSHYAVMRALRHLREKGIAMREGKQANTKYRKAEAACRLDLAESGIASAAASPAQK